jgi:hypothetical protein
VERAGIPIDVTCSDSATNGIDDERRERIRNEKITDNVSNSSLADRIAAVLWLEGCEDGAAAILGRLPTSETVTVRLALDVTYALGW